VADTWHSTPREAEMKRIKAVGQPEQKKFIRPYLNKKSWVWWCVPVIPETTGSINRRIVVQAGREKK
jgi:hypothetical protein